MRHIRISIAVITILLLCLGVVMVFSASGVFALERLGQSTYFLHRHLLFLAIGLCLTIVTMTIDYRDLQRYAKPLLLLAIALLVLVLIPGIGRESSGARRWFRIAEFSFQPSECAKLIMIIYAADFLSRKKTAIRSLWNGFVPIMGVVGFVSLLILKQPDLGTALFITLVVLIMIFVAGARYSHVGFLIAMAVPVFYHLVWSVPYRLQRITAFLHPGVHSRTIGFQLMQSHIALGSGGLVGIGLGHSMQKLFYLPAAHTDFIFSIVGEELGLLGTSAVVVLFLLFIWQGARIAKRTNEYFGYFLSVGIVTMIGLQAIINIGVAIGALPTKGLPLPFVSYGGSALIFNMMAVGLLLNISRTQEL